MTFGLRLHCQLCTDLRVENPRQSEEESISPEVRMSLAASEARSRDDLK
jgi:hypothetical protein